ncbi:MFS transporter [Coxiella endosymbiont of Rhipicephalus microplus]|uniref:MFS transporter n=1 Tax=Coxiella endosymbiont of Rhipicephalus microplus TaxID=1656186 RepID=UPI000CE5953D|nr:MFS transporter [Coxiella endosymbiont of Rhipicephalus microplus]
MAFVSKRLQLLSQLSFRWYFVSCLLATFGSGLSYVTLSWLILQVNNSVAAVAILMLCFWLPTVLLGPFLGVIVDGYSRKWLMIGGNAIRGIVLIFFSSYFSHHIASYIIYFLTILLGIGFSVYLPAAIALIREIVILDDLLYANFTIDIAYEMGNVAGMGLAGFFVACLSPAPTILVTGIIFILSTFALMRVKPTLQQIKKRKISYHFIIDDFKIGLVYLRKHPKLILIYSVQLLILVSFMTTPVLLAPFVKNVLQGSISQFGQIDAALSIGVVVGGIFMPWIADRWGLTKILMILCLLLAIFFSWFGANRIIIGAEILYFFIGLCLAVWPLMVTKAQHLTKFRFQARMQSIFNSLSGILILLIYLFVDIGSYYISIQCMYLFEVALVLSAFCLLWCYRRHVLTKNKVA